MCVVTIAACCLSFGGCVSLLCAFLFVGVDCCCVLSVVLEPFAVC